MYVLENTFFALFGKFSSALRVEFSSALRTGIKIWTHTSYQLAEAGSRPENLTSCLGGVVGGRGDLNLRTTAHKGSFFLINLKARQGRKIEHLLDVPRSFQS